MTRQPESDEVFTVAPRFIDWVLDLENEEATRGLAAQSVDILFKDTSLPRASMGPGRLTGHWVLTRHRRLTGHGPLMKTLGAHRDTAGSPTRQRPQT